MTIPEILPPVEIENGKLLPDYFLELQNNLLNENINNYNQAEFEDYLYFSDDIYFFPPLIISNVKLASKINSGYAIFRTNYHFNICWFVPLSNEYISEKIGFNGPEYSEGISFAFLFDWINSSNINMKYYNQKNRKKM